MNKTTVVMDKILDERELCDLECLSINAFQPLNSYMTKDQYTECLDNLTINNKSYIFPIPIVCMLDICPEMNSVIRLKNKTGIIHAELLVQECWEPNIEYECKCVFGSYDLNHPYVQYIISKKNPSIYYVSGVLNFKNIVFHNNYKEYRKTPAQIKSENNQELVGFQTRNPLHRSHIELIKNVSNMKVLLHPVEGVTQDCDIPFSIRMKCYQSILPFLGDVLLAILPLSMRMAGPREAVWHAVIRRNYGCTHFIVGRDHAGPSYKTKEGKSFYEPLEAQQLAKHLESKIGITIITSEEVVYCEDIKTYMTIKNAEGHNIKNISGTKFRDMLLNNEEIPEWYSYSDVITHLKNYYNKPKGVCFYFVGLSGSGKSTLAESLKSYIEEEYPYREVSLLDADIIRTHLSKGLGFSKEYRSMNVRRIGYVASEIVKHGGIVIVANIAPYEEDRLYNRNLISEYGKYIEFYVDTPIEICEERDIKGLYKLARQGILKNFTGISDPFEIPTNAININNKPLNEILDLLNPYCLELIRSNPRIIKNL
jgi:sulfate adenylyltransferase